jgi:hypothetical protein
MKFTAENNNVIFKKPAQSKNSPKVRKFSESGHPVPATQKLLFSAAAAFFHPHL